MSGAMERPWSSQLSDAGDRFGQALGALPEPFFIFAPIRDEAGKVVDLEYTYLNEAAGRLYGRDPLDVLGKSLAELFPSVRELGILACYIRPFETGEPCGMRVPTFDESGVKGAFDVAATPLGEEVVVTARDVTAQLAAEKALAKNEERYRLLADNVSDVVVHSCDGRVAWVSRSVVDVLGWERDVLVGQPLESLVHPEDAELTTHLQDIRGGADLVRGRVRTADDGHRWMQVNSRPFMDAQGDQNGVVHSMRDIAAQVLAEQLLESERVSGLLQAVQQSVAVFRAVRNHDGDIVNFRWEYANPQALESAGNPADGLVGLLLTQTNPEAVELGLFADLTDVVERRVTANREVVRVDVASREPIVVEYWASPYDDGVVVTYADVSQRYRMEQTLRFEARHDSLTGLPNRLLLADRLNAAMELNGRTGQPSAVLMMDLDRFKDVNDAYGHSLGDELLSECARRLSAAAAESDVVARWGGDEFVILRVGADAGGVVGLAHALLGSISTPIFVGGRSLRVTASMGIAVVDAGLVDVDDVLRFADAAMYRAKQSGRDRVEVFDLSMRSALQERMDTENELRRGIEAGELSVHYQPIVDASNGEVAGVEALTRWRHPRRGMLLPEEFVPLAEEVGLTDQVVCRATASACVM